MQRSNESNLYFSNCVAKEQRFYAFELKGHRIWPIIPICKKDDENGPSGSHGTLG
jgi:hypothetical protein